MIEIIAKNDERTRDFSGRYVMGGLPVGRNLFYPAAPLLVERSSGQTHACRKLQVTRDTQGYAERITIYHGEGGELFRARHETVRFVCDTADEVLALLNTQGQIRDAVSRRTFENEREIDAEIRAVLEEARTASPPAILRRM